MSLPTQNIDTRLLHADAAYSTVYALQITLSCVCKYQIINKLHGFIAQFCPIGSTAPQGATDFCV